MRQRLTRTLAGWSVLGSRPKMANSKTWPDRVKRHEELAPLWQYYELIPLGWFAASLASKPVSGLRILLDFKAAQPDMELWSSYNVVDQDNFTDAIWKDWNFHTRNLIRTKDKLAQWVDLNDQEVTAIDAVKGTYRWMVTPYYASLMSKTDEKCPIRLQAIPPFRIGARSTRLGVMDVKVSDRRAGISRRDRLRNDVVLADWQKGRHRRRVDRSCDRAGNDGFAWRHQSAPISERASRNDLPNLSAISLNSASVALYLGEMMTVSPATPSTLPPDG